MRLRPFHISGCGVAGCSSLRPGINRREVHVGLGLEEVTQGWAVLRALKFLLVTQNSTTVTFTAVTRDSHNTPN